MNRPAGATVITDATAVGSVEVDAHKQGGALPVAGAALTLAKSTASAELAGGAEKATVAKPVVSEPGVYGKAGRTREIPLQGEAAGREVGTPP